MRFITLILLVLLIFYSIAFLLITNNIVNYPIWLVSIGFLLSFFLLAIEDYVYKKELSEC